MALATEKRNIIANKKKNDIFDVFFVSRILAFQKIVFRLKFATRIVARVRSYQP